LVLAAKADVSARTTTGRGPTAKLNKEEKRGPTAIVIAKAVRANKQSPLGWNTLGKKGCSQGNEPLRTATALLARIKHKQGVALLDG
jgi:hypothetical protein